jgi:hypothetical protein
MIDATTTHPDWPKALSMTVQSKATRGSNAHLKATQPFTDAPLSTTHVQSLLMRLDGITTGDYMTWVRDPEPPALDHRLRSIGICAEPVEELVNIELVWAGPPPTTPRAAAGAAGFARTPEVVAARNADGGRRTVDSRTDAGPLSSPFPPNRAPQPVFEHSPTTPTDKRENRHVTDH